MKSIEILLRKFLLKLFLFVKGKEKVFPLPQFNSDSKILFIRLNRIGDALVTTPLFNQLKTKLGCKLFVLADRKNHFIFEHCPDVDETIVHKKGFGGLKKLNEFIKENNINVVVDLHDDVSTTVSLLIASANAKFKFGLEKNNQKIYTHTVKRPDAAKHHIVERVLEIIKLFGLNPEYSKAKTSYEFEQSSKNTAEIFFNKYNTDFIVGVNITAGSYARYWGIEKFKKLIQLFEERNINYVLFTTYEKFSDAKLIVDEKNIYPPSKDFDIFAAGIAKVNLLCTPDTSVVHIASMLKIPVFGLYVKYKTDDMIWSPYNSDFEGVVTTEPTLQNISFDEVKNKFIPFLENLINAKRNTKL